MAALTVEPGKTRLGWIGTGVMGRSMSGHLLAKGYEVTVYNRSREKAQDLLDRGAGWAATPKELASKSDVVFAIVGFPKDVREVFLGTDGALAGAKAGTVLVDMTTSEPSLAKEIYQAAKAKRVHAVDAPVSGGDIGAREARLSIMIGGDKEVVEALQPLWETMGKTIIYQGEAGSGQHTKAVNQTLIATMMIGVCEALLYVQGRARPEHGAAVGGSGGGGKLVAIESGTTNHRQQFRPRVLRRALHQRHGHRAR
jgi:3-hydroxyisobutyrate dehydrogenase